MPLGKGDNFVHDPKLTANKVVNFRVLFLHITLCQPTDWLNFYFSLQTICKVQLDFTDDGGVNNFRVTRLLKSSLSNKKKTTDIKLSIKGEDGNYVDQEKSKDLNRFVSNTLGVSEALINNVLFCHQEDSNWYLILSSRRLIFFND